MSQNSNGNVIKLGVEAFPLRRHYQATQLQGQHHQPKEIPTKKKIQLKRCRIISAEINHWPKPFIFIFNFLSLNEKINIFYGKNDPVSASLYLFFEGNEDVLISLHH